jgi:hypothetical protein
MGQASQKIAGASYGIALTMAKAMTNDQLPMSDWKRWEPAMPRAMRGLVRAGRYASEGRDRTATGATTIPFDVGDPDQLAEVVAQGLGFTPTRMSRYWDKQRAVLEAQAFWATRRGMLMKQFDHALQTRDASVIDDVRKAISRYNNEVAIPGLGISSEEIMNSIRARTKARMRVEQGLPANNRNIPLVQQMNKLFPEADAEVEVTSEKAPR